VEWGYFTKRHWKWKNSQHAIKADGIEIFDNFYGYLHCLRSKAAGYGS